MRTYRHPVLALFLLVLGLAPLAAAQQDGLAVSQENGSFRLAVRVSGETQVLRVSPAPIVQPKLLRVAGEDVVAVHWLELQRNAEPLPHYALSLDGRRFHPARQGSHDLHLRWGRFDPLRAPAQPFATLSSLPESRLFVVQYWTQGIEAYRRGVASRGGAVHRHLPPNADLVEIDPAGAAALEQLPYVRWVGPFHPAFKLEEELLEEQWRGWSEHAGRRVNVLTVRRGPAGQEPVAAFLERIGGTVHERSSETFLMSATLDLGQIAAAARHDGIQWIDRWSPPEEDMDIARTFHGADYLESVAGYTGAGVRVEVMDGGCDEIHPDIQNFAVHGGNTPSAHGTATSGIVVGSGSGNLSARGAMPDAFLAIADYSFMSGGSRYAHTTELQNPALSWKAVLQSNSWGNSRTTQYTSISQDLDLILFDHERISILQSQSNAGNQDSRPQAWAKNIISVGGVRHFDTLTKSDDSWSGGASIGPAADGRIKPDVASFYDNTLCTDQVGSAGYASGNYYCCFGGTSGATPITAGHLGLLYEMWSDGLFGNATPGSTVFDNRPHNTTAKALLINTSTQWSFSGTGHDLTRTHQGWGHADLQTAYDLRNGIYVIDEGDVLTNLQTATHALNVAAGTSALKATLVYRDPPGTTSSSLHRINDMDLKVTSPGGTVYWGNNGLLAGMWSSSGGSANTVDTVENVFVQNPQAGSWIVEIIASEVNQDTHVETPAVDADYALVVSGVQPGSPPPPVAGFTGAPLSGEAPLQVSFTDQSSGVIDTWAWDFGDLSGSAVQDPVHTYTAPGTYTVSLTVTGPGGQDTHVEAGYVTVTAPQPPAAPSGLTATAVSSSVIDLAWSDNSGNETGFEIERSPDGASWAPLTTTAANAASHADTGLVAATAYFYRVRAVNGVGASAWSNTASDTTFPAGSVDQVANADIFVSGTVSGTYVLTHAGDGSYQQFRERESGGRKSNRFSFLEHKWTFSVQAGNAITLFARAHRSAPGDGDDFVLAWSTDDVAYTDLFAVTKTSDDGSYQSASLPASVSGTVYVRVRDTDRTPGNRGLDFFYADHLYIRSEGTGGGVPPAAPSNLTATAVSSSQIDLAWTDNSGTEDGFDVEHSADGVSWSALASPGANATAYSDTGLSPSTTWFYRVRAFNAAGASAWSNVDDATTPGAGTVDQVADGEIFISGTVTGSYLDTGTPNGVYEQLQERESGGKKANRTSFLEHKWTVPVQAGATQTFFVKAYHSPSSDGDDFQLWYSTDDVSYTLMVTVTKTSDDGSYQSFALPPGLSGTVYVRATDSDQTPGNRAKDTLFVDHMFIRTQ